MTDRAPERADAIVVGARCAGSAAAIGLVRAGRRVVVLERASFPAETISTHLIWPGGLAEFRELGVLEAVEAIGAPQMPVAYAAAEGLEIRAGYTPVGGIDYAMCVRRAKLDAALADAARAVGAEIREGVKVVGLVGEGARVGGVRYEADGEESEIRAPLVIGADGRRSTVAREVGSQQPYRARRSGRACYYGYWSDPRPDWRQVAAQWRQGGELGTAFPCDEGHVLCLLQPPVARVEEFKAGIEEEYRRTVASIPPLAERLGGAELVGKVRSATNIESYFRRSSGPGWALAGDAGHFKDPVTAQGIRDALRYGRLLGERAGPLLDDPIALDRVLAEWERERERDCIEVYQWTDTLARGEPMSALEIEVYRTAARDPKLARAMADVFARTIAPSDALGPTRALRIAARGLVGGETPRRALVRALAREARVAARDARERRQVRAAAPAPEKSETSCRL